MDLEVKNVSYSIQNIDIVKSISLKVTGNTFHTILGPNGCGKTTFLKTIYRINKPNEGVIYLNGKDLKEISIRESAKNMAVVAQFNEMAFESSVLDIVLLGRTPHLNFIQRESKEDYEIAYDALKRVGMYEKREQSYLTLSGGEKQRIVLARALAQKPSLLLLDEPLNHLDIKYQLEILKIIKESNINVLAVLHDVQLASKFSDYIYLMKDGEIKYEGKPSECITKENLYDIYGVKCDVIKDDNSIIIKYI